MAFPALADGAEPDPTDEFLDGDPITIEQQARAMGWKPFEEYSGDPRRWTDAETFVKKGLEELPVLRDQNHRMATKLTRMGDEISKLRVTATEQAKAVQDALRMARNASQAGYDRALRELKQKQREAVGAGDEVAFDQIEEQIEALETERAAVEAAPTEEPAPRDEPPASAAPVAINPAVLAFTKDPANRWFFDARRPYLKTAMIQLHIAVKQEGEITDEAEQLAEAKQRLEEMYPDDFAAPAPRRAAAEEDLEEEEDPVAERRPAVPPRRAPAVAQPSRAPITPNRQRRSPFEQIDDPTERSQAREAFERMRSMDPGLTEGEYMELYTNPHADALALRKKRKPA